jgi:hypothetical protein
MMSVTEDRRIALLEAAHQHWGRDVAVTLMEMLPPSGWGDVATRQRVDALERGMDLRFQLVDQRLEALETKLDARIDGLEAGLDARIDGLEAGLDARIDGLEAGLDARIDGLETKLDARIDGLETKLDARIDGLAGELAVTRRELHADLAAAEARTIRWIVGTGLGIVGALSGIGGLLVVLH